MTAMPPFWLAALLVVGLALGVIVWLLWWSNE